MTDTPALIVNIGIMVLTGVMALVAFVQARAAVRDAAEAKDARDTAVAAQEASATALREANLIAIQARDSLSERLELEQRREARLRERRDVQWGGSWPDDIGKDDPPTFELANIGTTDAHSVVLTVKVGDETQTFEVGAVPAGKSSRVQLRGNAMSGPLAQAFMQRRNVFLHMHWVSPAGHPDERPGQVWPVN